MLSRLALLLLVFTATHQAFADVVTLSNGDRITGKIQRIEKGRIVISTEYAGEIKIDWGRITALVSDDPMTVQLADESRVYGKLAGDSTSLKVLPVEGGQERDIPSSDVDAVFPGNMLQDKFGLSGKLNLGATQTSGNTRTSTLLDDAELVARKGKDRYTIGGAANRSSENDVETASNALAYLKYDRFFTKKWYATAQGTGEHDVFKDIDFRGAAGIGLGYQWIESARTNLALEGGLDYVYTNFYSQPTQAYPAPRVALKFDYYIVPNRLQFFHLDEEHIGFGADTSSFARTQTGLRVPIWTNFLLTLQYNADWNEHPPPGFVHVDRMTLLTLGYHW